MQGDSKAAQWTRVILALGGFFGGMFGLIWFFSRPSASTTAAPEVAVGADAQASVAPDAATAEPAAPPVPPEITRAREVLAPMVRAAGFAFPSYVIGGPAPNLSLDSQACSRRNLQRLAERIAADDAASAAVARATFRWLTCTPVDGYESIFIEMPPAGARVPRDLVWGDYLATTPVGHRRGPESMWCYDTTGDRGHAWCFVEEAACRARRAEVASLLPDVTECLSVDELWCYPTRGTERRCAIERSDCEARRDRLGDPRGRCTARYPR